jgi:hypothetical protein
MNYQNRETFTQAFQQTERDKSLQASGLPVDTYGRNMINDLRMQH